MKDGSLMKKPFKSIRLTPSKKAAVHISKHHQDSSNQYLIQQHDQIKSRFNSFINSISNQNYRQALSDLPFYANHFSQLHYSIFQCFLMLMTHSYETIPSLISSNLLHNNCSHNLLPVELTIHDKRMISYLIIPIAKIAEEALVFLSIPQIESFSDITAIQTIFSSSSHSMTMYTLILLLLNLHKHNDCTKLIEFLLNQIGLLLCADCALCTFIRKIIKKISSNVKLTKRLVNPRLTICIKNNCFSAKKLMQECQITKLKTDGNFSSSFQKYIENASNSNNSHVNKAEHSWHSNSKNSFMNCSKITNERRRLIGNNTSTQDKSFDMFKGVKPKEVHYQRKSESKARLYDMMDASSGDAIDKHILSIQNQLLLLERTINQFKVDTEYIQAQLLSK